MISLVMIRALLLELAGLQEAQEKLAVSSPLLFKNLLSCQSEAAAARRELVCDRNDRVRWKRDH